MKNVAGIILAAGEGRRMQSDIPKVLHKICGRPMLDYVLQLSGQLGIRRKVAVIGHQARQVKRFLQDRNIKTVRQARLLGSGDAVWRTKGLFANFNGDLVVLYGDTPLVTYQSLKKLIQYHQKNGVACTLLTANLINPTSFGRIIRDADDRIVKIAEEQDADTYEKAIGEINVGVYCFRAQALFAALPQIKPANAKKEYYLTDVIKILSRTKSAVGSVSTPDADEAQGVNSRRDLVKAEAIINRRNSENLIAQGATVIDPATTYIYGEVEVGRDTIIYPHTIIEGKVRMGKSCRIGPFARIRSDCVFADNVQIGNFVEVVRSRVAAGSKIKHHSYIGDTTIGKGVNVGAGTIIANYNGKRKYRTVIGDGAFIGSGTILVAPVKVGSQAVTGAGSVVTKNRDVPAGATVVGIPAKVLKKEVSNV